MAVEHRMRRPRGGCGHRVTHPQYRVGRCRGPARPAGGRLAGRLPIMSAPEGTVSYRRATPEDAVACHDVMWASVTDLGRRQGNPLRGSAREWWRSSEPLHRLLAELAA